AWRVRRETGARLRGRRRGERRRTDRGLHAAHALTPCERPRLRPRWRMTRRAGDVLDRLDRAHLVHGFGSPGVADAEGTLRLVRGKGAYVWDSDGRRYLDGLSSLWNVAIGHGRAEIARAVAAQARTLAYAPTLLGFSTEPAIRLAARIARMAP